jgi:hypothetical protein
MSKTPQNWIVAVIGLACVVVYCLRARAVASRGAGCWFSVSISAVGYVGGNRGKFR